MLENRNSTHLLVKICSWLGSICRDREAGFNISGRYLFDGPRALFNWQRRRSVGGNIDACIVERTPYNGRDNGEVPSDRITR